MYVCICQSVKDAEVRQAIAAGADDVEQLGELLGVGISCGCCREVAQVLIDEHGAASPALSVAVGQ